MEKNGENRGKLGVISGKSRLKAVLRRTYPQKIKRSRGRHKRNCGIFDGLVFTTGPQRSGREAAGFAAVLGNVCCFRECLLVLGFAGSRECLLF